MIKQFTKMIKLPSPNGLMSEKAMMILKSLIR